MSGEGSTHAGTVVEGEAGSTSFLDQHRHHAIQVGTVILVVLFWEFLAYVAFQDRLGSIFVPLEEITATAVTLLVSGTLTEHILLTTREVLFAFLIAAVLGLAVGTVLGSNEFLADAIEPLIYYVSTVPKIVYYPLLIMVFGVGPGSKIAKGVLSAFFPIVVLVTAGALNVNPVHRNVARMYNSSRWQTFRRVYLPSTVTYVLNGMRLGIGTAIISVMLAELFVSKAGLGNQLNFYFSQLQMEKMYAVLLIVFVSAFTLNLGLLQIQSYLVGKGYGTGEGGEQGFGF